jgi:hypothetical protein
VGEDPARRGHLDLRGADGSDRVGTYHTVGAHGLTVRHLIALIIVLVLEGAEPCPYARSSQH